MKQVAAKLTPIIIKAIDVYLDNPNLKYREIAEKIGKKCGTISMWFNSPVVQEEIDRRYKEQWQQTSKKAQKKMESLINSDREDIALQASKYILDSCGYKPKEKIEVSSKDVIKINITSEDS